MLTCLRADVLSAYFIRSCYRFLYSFFDSLLFGSARILYKRTIYVDHGCVLASLYVLTSRSAGVEYVLSLITPGSLFIVADLLGWSGVVCVLGLLRASLQLRILRLGFFQDGNVGVGVFPEREEIFVTGECPDTGGVGIHAL